MGLTEACAHFGFDGDAVVLFFILSFDRVLLLGPPSRAHVETQYSICLSYVCAILIVMKLVTILTLFHHHFSSNSPFLSTWTRSSLPPSPATRPPAMRLRCTLLNTDHSHRDINAATGKDQRVPQVARPVHAASGARHCARGQHGGMDRPTALHVL